SFAAASLINIASSTRNVLLPFVTKNDLHASARGLGFVYSAASAGALVSAFAYGQHAAAPDRRRVSGVGTLALHDRRLRPRDDRGPARPLRLHRRSRPIVRPGDRGDARASAHAAAGGGRRGRRADDRRARDPRRGAAPLGRRDGALPASESRPPP